jgi:hypothetical protein
MTDRVRRKSGLGIQRHGHAREAAEDSGCGMTNVVTGPGNNDH